MGRRTKAEGIFRKALDRTGINLSELSRATGIPYNTLRNLRLKPKHEGTFRLYELQAIARHVWFEDAELVQLIRGKA